jgi:ketosteroid isomerase-like protein
MKRMLRPLRARRLALLAAVLYVVAPGAAAAQPTPAEADSILLVSTLEQFVRAFNDLEWDAFSQHFADDATVFQPLPGVPLRNAGRAEFEAVFRQLFETVRARQEGPPFLNIEPNHLHIQMLGDVAVATFHLRPDAPLIGRRTLVLQKRGAVWSIVHLHASLAEAAGEGGRM